MTDLDAPITVARDDLEDIADRIGDLYDHYYAPDWQPDTADRRLRDVH